RSTRGRGTLRILMCASEAHPFSKTGGLADVVSSLARALGRLGHDVTVVTPRYRGAPAGDGRGQTRIGAGDEWFDATFFEAPLGERVRAILVDCPPLYDRAGLYVEDGADYPDNPLRFAA